ncbi:ion transporter [Idiomarina xiamenensis]|uniref:Ion transport protein n=1 Tax=Idiomarina xiamenensis 10-D-4 TaxID=740709 RepID=K2L693_9GAMM|nr:ion transporter [Idiomarina xiamenensis]EKE85295.1 Ion transport protein [Idiomarina xiamenensis 10-D-4]
MKLAYYRRLTAALLEGNGQHTLPGKIINYALMALIFLNVAAVMAESVASIYQSYRHAFQLFETFSIIVFSIEYALRVWSIVEIRRYRQQPRWRARLQYALSPMALVDLFAILPGWLNMVVTIDLRFLRVLRLLRLFKFTRYSRAFRMLLAVLHDERKNLFAAFSVLFVLMILASSGIYIIESDVQPDKFASIPAAMWWAVTTLTTVGYGDVTPITPLGRLFGGMITLIGMGMVALPAGILASGFSEQLARRRSHFKILAEHILADGQFDAEDAETMEQLRRALDIDRHTASLIIRQLIKHQRNDNT